MKYIALLLINFAVFSQSISSATQEINKINKEGFAISMANEEKNVAKDLAIYLAKFGAITKKKDVFTSMNSRISDVSTESLQINAKIDAAGAGKSVVFVSADFVDRPLTAAMPEYKAFEEWMYGFVKYSQWAETLRIAEKDLKTSQEAESKLQKVAEKLVKDKEKNKKEKENLLKKIEENKADLIALDKQTEQNIKDVENAKKLTLEKESALNKIKSSRKD